MQAGGRGCEHLRNSPMTRGQHLLAMEIENLRKSKSPKPLTKPLTKLRSCEGLNQKRNRKEKNPARKQYFTTLDCQKENRHSAYQLRDLLSCPHPILV